jgi:hypothetical protein
LTLTELPDHHRTTEFYFPLALFPDAAANVAVNTKQGFLGCSIGKDIVSPHRHQVGLWRTYYDRERDR